MILPHLRRGLKPRPFKTEAEANFSAGCFAPSFGWTPKETSGFYILATRARYLQQLGSSSARLDFMDIPSGGNAHQRAILAGKRKIEGGSCRLPSFKCNYPDDRESRERNEKIAFVPAILGSLIPLGFSMPVAWKWPLWAVSLISVVYLALAFIPFLARLANGQKFFIGLAAMSAAIAAFWPVISQQWRAEKSAYVEGDFEPPRKAATLLNLEIGNSGSV
ncbi:MAG: hypothetical protein WA477_18280, partial [Candidatus Sulfotelmatobacter sp.]